MRKLFTIIIGLAIVWTIIIGVFALVNLIVTFIFTSPFLWIPLVALGFMFILWMFSLVIRAVLS